MHCHYTLRFIRPYLLLTLLLTACGVGPAPLAPTEFSSVASIDIPADAEQAQIEAQYGGAAVVFRPEAGFAVLAFTQQQDGLTTLSTSANQNTFATPEVSAGGNSVWGGGNSVWGGGWDAWAGGNSVWGGGNSVWGGGSPTTLTQNLSLWDQVNLPEGQSLAPNLGGGVKVAVIDTGIDLLHPAFAGRLAPVSEWKDFVDGDNYPQEVAGNLHGHGTGVAGVVLQVAPNVTILPLRVLDGNGLGNTDDVIAAIDWAFRKGADVINLSLGATVDVAALNTMVNYVASRGVYVVSSSGNTGDRSVTYPAANANLGSGDGKYLSLGVGSVSSGDKKSGFSTYGDRLELVAPGESLYTPAPDAQIGYWSGTSFAAPVASGALALGAGEKLSSADEYRKLAEHLGASARDVSDKNPGTYLGYGRLDIQAFMRKALGL